MYLAFTVSLTYAVGAINGIILHILYFEYKYYKYMIRKKLFVEHLEFLLQQILCFYWIQNLSLLVFQMDEKCGWFIVLFGLLCTVTVHVTASPTPEVKLFGKTIVIFTWWLRVREKYTLMCWNASLLIRQLSEYIAVKADLSDSKVAGLKNMLD